MVIVDEEQEAKIKPARALALASITTGTVRGGRSAAPTNSDEGVFTTPWSATITYRPGFNWRGATEWPELVCDQNRQYAAVPRANKPDF
jgi:hypothetical protein